MGSQDMYAVGLGLMSLGYRERHSESQLHYSTHYGHDMGYFHYEMQSAHISIFTSCAHNFLSHPLTKLLTLQSLLLDSIRPMSLFRRRDVAQAFRKNHQLQQFILTDVTPTGTVLGTGSYGSVEEVSLADDQVQAIQRA